MFKEEKTYFLLNSFPEIAESFWLTQKKYSLGQLPDNAIFILSDKFKKVRNADSKHLSWDALDRDTCELY